jgi:hypothetical protein
VEEYPSLERLRPHHLSDLIRVGGEGDGGYVVNERAVRLSRYLLSFGVEFDWSFELDFLQRNPNVGMFCFDPSVSKEAFLKKTLNAVNEVLSLRFAVFLCSFNFPKVRRKLSDVVEWARIYRGFSRFLANEKVHFYATGVSNEHTKPFITFGEALQLVSSEEIPENSVFVKMDIEVSEFRVLPDLLKYVKCVNALVVEFHDLDILWARFVELTERLKADFEITHVHGNNYGGLIPQSGTPKVLEVTFLKKSLIGEPCPPSDSLSYPLSFLDSPNNPTERDYPLVF